ncbi:hypothetical protein [Bacteroides sp. 224]|nr:hypothetical protein [Bacteroides sp. 224]
MLGNFSITAMDEGTTTVSIKLPPEKEESNNDGEDEFIDPSA